MLAICGFVDAFLYVYGLAHPPTQAGFQMFIGFSLNVAMLGWCYVDAEEKMIAISGVLGFAMLFISIIGVPAYFLRSRGLVGALKNAFGLGLYALWLSTLMVGMLVAIVVSHFLG
jgi:hypothetical protein